MHRLGSHGYPVLAALLALAGLLTAGCGRTVASTAPTSHQQTAPQATVPQATLPAKWHGHPPVGWSATPAASDEAPATGAPLPIFTDWRIAYIGQDSHLHVIALDGTHDSTGVAAPVYGAPGSAIYTAGATPDGRRLAYDGGLGVQELEIATDKRMLYPNARGNLASGRLVFNWSPNGNILALPGWTNEANVALLNLADGTFKSLPATADASQLQTAAYGWLEATHVAVEYTPTTPSAPSPSAPPINSRLGAPQIAAGIASLDITTGSVRQIAILTPHNLCSGGFSLAPDGTVALFSNASFRGFPFTPDGEVVDMQTGRHTVLPHLTHLLASGEGIQQVLWRPHTHVALLKAGYGQNTYYLYDVATDTLTPVSLPTFPVAWTPDGRALVLATSDDPSGDGPVGFSDVGQIGAGPFTLSVVSIDASGQLSTPQVLPAHPIDIPLLGIVRNP